MQCENDTKELHTNSDIKLSKSVKDLSDIHDANKFDSEHSGQTVSYGKDSSSLSYLDNNEMFSIKSSLSSSSINFMEPQLTKMHLDTLSEGTRNFLNELAASNSTNSFNDNISGYALSSINSPLLSLKSKKATESNFNNNHKKEPALDNEDNALCSELGVENKDVISTLCNVNNVNKEGILQFSNENKTVTNAPEDISIQSKDVTDVLCNISNEGKDITRVVHNINDDTMEVSSVLCNINEENNEVISELSAITNGKKDATSTLINISETKDVTTALDLIEQSTLNDRDLSSAEICNSLNQIFCETASDLTANAISNVESSETTETQVDMETNSITLCMDNESEIYLQTVESGISFTADETGTINLSDLSSGNNAEFWQRVLLVQDESGNIETVYLLQDDKVEGLCTEISNVEYTTSEENIENSEINQYMIIDNTPSDNLSDITKNDADDTRSVLVTQDALSGEALTNTLVDAEMLTSQNDIDVNQECLNVDIPAESKIQLTSNGEENNLTQLENNVNINVNSENKLHESQSTILKQSSDDLVNIQETLPKYSEKSAEIIIQKEYLNNTNLELENGSSEISAHLDDSESKSCNNLSSKAKKSISFSLLSQNKSAEDSVLLCETLNNVSGTSSVDKIAVNHMNGAIYHSECNQTLLTKAQCYNATGKISESDQSELCEQISNKSIQKSKKSFQQNILGRSAKKSIFGTGSSNFSLDYSSLKILQTHDENSPEYIRIRNMILKRSIENELVQNNKRAKTNCSDMEEDTNRMFRPKNQTIALKTFKKPFTAAKKSVFDSREVFKPVRNTAMKTFVPKMHKVQSALKSFSWKQDPVKFNQTIPTEENVNIKHSYGHQTDLHDRVLFQPEICEIRILPNDYVKRASHLLRNGNNVGPASTPEDYVSEEDIKLPSGYTSPVKEFLPHEFYCSCVAKEVPCICNDQNLQLTCEAEDSVDGNAVPCSNAVSKQYLLTPSHEIKHRAFCDIHLWRLREHHCCPKCGIFCSHGEFLLCLYEDPEKVEKHLFHSTCSIVIAPGLPPSCPHCCKFSSFNPVQLINKDHLQQEEVPSNAQNITNELNGCDIYLVPKEEIEQQTKADSSGFVPDKKELRVMITSLANEKSLRLRPTGKCLYNPIKTGDTQKVMQLIGNGVNPNHKFRTHSNNSPIHVAVYYGWTGILHILLQAGAFIDAVNDDLETPLIVAVERNNLPIVRYLVLAGAQIDVKDCNGMTSFHIASKNGFKEIAEFLYSTGTVDINLQDDGGWTALVWASEHKHVEFVKWLLDIGADPNVRDNEENTVLHWAAYSGKTEIAELLLDKGCTLSYVNKRGDSALHIAAREDNYECVRFFINRGAVVDQKNKENKTPLMCCQDDSLSFNYLCQSISSGALKIGKMQLEKHVVFRDISRGAEAYPIQAINEVDDEEFIMEFRYVVKNCHRSGANINIVSTVDSIRFCYCKDNCVTRDCNCTTNSKCWYDANGCLTSEYNLQNAPVIFECNKTCHCPNTCINRVVQQGLRYPLQLFRTQYKGWGVRTLQVIPKGAFVCEYVGELITGSEATQRDDDTYFFDLESKGSDYCLDGRYYGNVARFLNHSCDPNLMAVKVFVDHQDLNFPRIAFFAVRRIQAFEELCFDYGLDFWIVKCQSILCTCNTQSCKYSKDTIDDTLIKFFGDTRYGAQLESAS